MARSNFKDINEYIETFPKDVQPVLKGLRAQINKLIPGAEEGISYQIPVFKLNGKFVIYFAAFKNHVSLYPIPAGPASFGKEIAPYIKGKGTISFPLDKPAPMGLVTKIVKLAIIANKNRTNGVYH